MRTTLLPTLLAVLATASVGVSADVWIEAEQFDQLGGWVNDAQFVDQMGSPYLLAVGLGTPVDDAVTRVGIPQPGSYRLWVRTKDWIPEHHPGRFQVVLNERVVDTIFGQSETPDWHWRDGGTHDLPGEVEIRLHDTTGYYGRCDAIVLSRDLDWTPPDAVDQIASLRQRLGGVSPRIENMPEADVVVVGGGLAGCTAAVAAARNGMRVTLLQNRPILGGNASTEILVPPVGAWAGIFRSTYPLDPRETGFLEEYRTPGNQRVAEGKLYSSRLLRFVRTEPKLDLRLNTHATGVEMTVDKRIAAVLAVDTQTGRRMRFTGKMFVDCTGDGVIGVAAGAEYRHGKEPKSLYNEPWAPDEPSGHTMGNGLKYFAQETGEPQSFTAPPWARQFPTCDSFGPGRHPPLTTSQEIGNQWKIELGGTQDTYADAEQIRDDLLRLIYGIWDHTKNHCSRHSEKAVGYELVWVGHVAGKRENRRLIGDYVLTQNDIGRRAEFDDAVAFGAWSVDDHYSEGFFHDGPTGMHFDRTEHHHRGVPFSIPFRCLYSRNVDNLMMAGRNISASHLGFSDTRVMLTCAIMGHAAGTGAAFCVDRETSPRGVWRNHIDALQQQLLKEGATVRGVRAADPRDLAYDAETSASSESTHTSGEEMAPSNVVNGFAKAVGRRGEEATNAWRADPEANGPHWVELAWPDAIDFNAIHVTFQTPQLAPRRFAVEASDGQTWTRILEVSDNRHRRHVLGIDRVRATALRVVLEEPAAICEIRLYDEPRHVVESARRAHANMRLADQGPWLPWPVGKQLEKYAGMVIDASDARAAGYWAHSTWSEPFLLDGYLHDANLDKGKKTLVFEPRVTESGRYEIRLAYVAYTNRATNTPVTVTTPRASKTVRVNQRLAPPIDGMFVSLGEFPLEADQPVRVEISNADTDGYVVVDAIQLIRIKATWAE